MSEAGIRQPRVTYEEIRTHLSRSLEVSHRIHSLTQIRNDIEIGIQMLDAIARQRERDRAWVMQRSETFKELHPPEGGKVGY